MSTRQPLIQADCIVAGASFSGLACATALAQQGIHVTVLEKKSDAGEKLHTTGIVVRDAMDQIALLDQLPAGLTRRIEGVRLYAPNMQHIDLLTPGYFFLTTDTPNLMRWLAARAEQAGARILYQTPFIHAERTQSGFFLPGIGSSRFLVGADGANSQVARSLGLGQNTQRLFGIEYEFADTPIGNPEKLHCFIDKHIAPGYIGWVAEGLGVTQVGLARRMRDNLPPMETAMAAFLEKIAPVFDFRGMSPTAIRAGMIPCGGTLERVAAPRALLIGDAAGLVSPVTAGGIHSALKYGLAAGNAIADFLNGKQDDPAQWLTQAYPQYIAKRLLRYAYDHFQSDWMFNLLLDTRLMRQAAEAIYFGANKQDGR